ncbi:unnamed protein product [Ixodes hexagonus]
MDYRYKLLPLKSNGLLYSLRYKLLSRYFSRTFIKKTTDTILMFSKMFRNTTFHFSYALIIMILAKIKYCI